MTPQSTYRQTLEKVVKQAKKVGTSISIYLLRFFKFTKAINISLADNTHSYSNTIYIQQGTNIQERLLNKPYVNDVTLRGQKSPLKCC